MSSSPPSSSSNGSRFASSSSGGGKPGSAFSQTTRSTASSQSEQSSKNADPLDYFVKQDRIGESARASDVGRGTRFWCSRLRGRRALGGVTPEVVMVARRAMGRWTALLCRGQRPRPPTSKLRCWPTASRINRANDRWSYKQLIAALRHLELVCSSGLIARRSFLTPSVISHRQGIVRRGLQGICEAHATCCRHQG